MLNEVSIEIIRRCPNNCLHCSSMSNEFCDEILDYTRFVAVVEDAAKLGARTICFSGGEPFLHDRIADMIAFVASLGLQSYVYTSGIIFDKQGNRETLNNDVLKLISKNVSKLIFNIEAANPNTYDKIMGTTGCFEKMMQSITNANSNLITTEAHFVPMALNVNEAEDVIALCRELGISKVSFLRLVIHGRAQINEAELSMTHEDLDSFKSKLEEIKKQSEIDIRIGVPLSLETSCHKCEAAQGKLNIRYDGTVFPCEVFKNERISHGLSGVTPESVYEKTLNEIYKHSSYLNIVRDLSQNFSCGNHCETCIGQYLIDNGGEHVE